MGCGPGRAWEILRILIKEVIQEYRDAETIRLRIVWVDCAPDTALELKLGPYTNRLMREMHTQGLDPSTIAERLNGMGVFTRRDLPWTRHTVAHKLKWMQS